MSIIYTHLGDAIQKLIENASPILFCDTCALLDLIRLPLRENQPTKVNSCLDAATSILQSIQMGSISLVTPPPVYDEWNTHAQKIQSEVKKHFNDLEKNIKVAKAIAQIFNQSLPLVNFKELNLPSTLYNLGQNLIDLSIKLEKEEFLSDRILNRAALNTPPASKGGVGDCILYVHTLSVIEKLRKQSFNKSIVFFTSNTRDFCEGGNPKEPIKNEILALQTELVTTWNWAFKSLNTSSH